MTARTPGEQALAYAAYGWPVFPCRPGGKEPATPHGFLDATTDPDRIAWWWRRQPGANVAVATGLPGPDVLDIDQHRDAGNGFAALNRLIRPAWPGTPARSCPRRAGGCTCTSPAPPSGPAGCPSCHLDFKAAGGYVLAPPSAVGGRPYRVIRHQPRAADLDWAQAARLLEPQRQAAARPAQADPGDPGRLAGWVRQLPEGSRNDGLFWAACRAAETGDPQALRDIAQAARDAGLDGPEIAATIRSACRTAGQALQPPDRAGRECAP